MGHSRTAAFVFSVTPLSSPSLNCLVLTPECKQGATSVFCFVLFLFLLLLLLFLPRIQCMQFQSNTFTLNVIAFSLVAIQLLDTENQME